MQKTLIGVTTYNRKKILEAMSKSLYESDLSIDYSIRVYDDNSSEYGYDELKTIFPNAEKIYVRGINVGADLNTWGMYCDFLESDYDYLFNADSDLLFSKNWLREGMKYIKETDGILSLFNTSDHEAKERKNDLLVKRVFGAAGTLFTRDSLKELFEAYNRGDFSPSAIDWGFCDYFTKKGKELYCTSNSYVQHIGLIGLNSGGKGFVYGENFKVDTLHNGQVINDILANFEESKNVCQDILGYYLFPFDRIEKDSSIVLYGSGVVGRDYKRQIEQTKYCRILTIIDKKYDNVTVLAPETIKEMKFDAIVISTVNCRFVQEMIDTIKKIRPDVSEDNIVVANSEKIRI